MSDENFVKFLTEDNDDIKDLLEKVAIPSDIFDNEEKEDALLKKLCMNIILENIEPECKSVSCKEEILFEDEECLEDDPDDFIFSLPSPKKTQMPKKTGRKNKKQKLEFTPPKDSEFIDSDIDDEQLQLYLKSVKKKKYAKPTKKGQEQSIERPLRQRLATDLYIDASDEEFFKDLRVTRRTFDYLLLKIKESKMFHENYAGVNIPVTPKMGLEIFLIYMGQKCNFKFISQKYFISESSVMINFMRVVEALIRLDETEIVWPSTEEQKSIEENYRLEYGEFPGIVGSVGACCLEMRTNKEPPAGYKIGSQRSIMYLLAVTDALLKFTYIQAGFPGTFSIQEAFENSSLGKSIQDDPSSIFGSDEYHLLGSSDLSLHKNILVPYSETAILTDVQRNFNDKHSNSFTVNKAFNFLRSRFCVFSKQLYASLEKIPNIIKVCCIIHNIALRDENDLRFLEPYLVYQWEDYSEYREETDFVFNKPDVDGICKRERISVQLVN